MYQKTPLVLKVLLVLLLLAAAVLSYRALSDPLARLSSGGSSERISLVGMYRLAGDTQDHPLREDTAFDSSVPTTIFFQGHFSRNVEPNEAIILRINNLRVEMAVNGKTVFTFGQPGTHPAFLQTGGSVYTSFVSDGISQQDTVTLVLSNVYTNILPTAFQDFFHDMHAGSEYAAYRQILNHYWMDIAMSAAAMLIGLCMLAVLLISRNGGGVSRAQYLYMAGVIVSSGGWFISGSPVISLLLPFPAFNEVLYSLSINLMSMFFFLYALTFVKSRIRNTLVVITAILMLAITISTAVQWFGMADLYAMLSYHLFFILIVSVVYACCLLRELIRLRSGEMRIVLGSLLILPLGAIADMVNYFFGFYLLSVGYRVAFLLYAMLQLMLMIRFLRRNAARMRDYAQMENALLQSRINLMLSQIKPHFLFNALNAISALCLTEPVKADAAVCKLSSYLRGNIHALEAQEPIPFQQELSHVQNYVDIESMRFSHRLRVEYRIGFDSFRVPALCVQTLMENAIRHGVGGKPEGGTVCLETLRENDDAVVRIIDDGAGFDCATMLDATGVGLRNSRFRLQNMVGAEMDIQSQCGAGTTVTIRIPLQREETQ